jgi:phage repressor protein C with HTH and peptisase S24 domain
MLTHDDILTELIRQLEAKEITASKVAARLNIAPARVTEMKNGGRRVQSREMPVLAELLKMAGATTPRAKVSATAQVRNLGKVAQGLWLEQTYQHPDEPEFVAFDMRPGDPGPDELFAVTPEGLSMNLRFPPGVQLICRRVSFGSGSFKSGDLVIVERHNHDLRELTCKRLVIDDDGLYWLHSESDQPQFQAPWRIGKPDNGDFIDTEIEVIGKVLRGVIDYEN